MLGSGLLNWNALAVGLRNIDEKEKVDMFLQCFGDISEVKMVEVSMRRELKKTGQEMNYLDLMEAVQDMVDTMTTSSSVPGTTPPGAQDGQQPHPPLNPFQGAWQGEWKGRKGKGKGKSNLPQELQDGRNSIPPMTQNYCVYFQLPPVGPGDRTQVNGEWRCRNPKCTRVHQDAPLQDQDSSHRFYQYSFKVGRFRKAKAEALKTAEQAARPQEQATQQAQQTTQQAPAGQDKGADTLPDAWANAATKNQ